MMPERAMPHAGLLRTAGTPTHAHPQVERDTTGHNTANLMNDNNRFSKQRDENRMAKYSVYTPVSVDCVVPKLFVYVSVCAFVCD